MAKPKPKPKEKPEKKLPIKFPSRRGSHYRVNELQS